MKKVFLLAVSLLLTVTTVFAERVSQEDAALVANNFNDSIQAMPFLALRYAVSESTIACLTSIQVTGTDLSPIQPEW